MVNYFGFVLIAVFAVSCNGADVAPRISDTHNINDCDLSAPLTNPLLQTNINEPAQFWKVLRRTVTYTGSLTNPVPIKCIQVTNLDSSDTGGYPSLLKGGVGAHDAEILMVSRRSRPLNFRIEIWG